LSFSLHTLASHGSDTGTTNDGWGVAFYQDHDVALFREPAAAGESALVRFLESEGPATDLAISHIRRATQGTLKLANTQPFVREINGRMHVFAHNGNLTGIENTPSLLLTRDHPLGQTDSEHAFCALLTRVRGLWNSEAHPSIDLRIALVSAYAADISELGPANFLYFDGDALFAYGHQRMQNPGGKVESPGLWMLPRHCSNELSDSKFQAGISFANDNHQNVMLIASVPLTDENWQPFQDSQLVVVRSGQQIY